MSTIFFIITIVVGILFEWTLGYIVPSSLYLPFFALCLFFWFWRLRLWARLGVALLAGLYSDSIFFLTPGTYVIMFGMLAFFTEALRIFFSNTFSRATQILGIIILTAIFLVLTPSVSNIVEYIRL